jgi:hypothetical protein
VSGVPNEDDLLPDDEFAREVRRVHDQRARLREILNPEASKAPAVLEPAIRKAVSEDLERLEHRSAELNAAAARRATSAVTTEDRSQADVPQSEPPGASHAGAGTSNGMAAPELAALLATAAKMHETASEAQHLAERGNRSFALTCLSLIDPLVEQFRQDMDAARRVLERNGAQGKVR